jgi:GDPmannose 4,6-dehydratase
MFGNPAEATQIVRTLFRSQKLYAINKVYTNTGIAHYRDTHGMFPCSGILYKHVSPRRNIQFATRKLKHIAAAIKLGFVDTLLLGVASRMIIRSFYKQIIMKSASVFHGPHWCLLLSAN